MRVPRRARPVLAKFLLLPALAGADASAQPLPGEAARDQKIARLVATTEASPKDVGSYRDRGVALAHQGKLTAAVADLGTALRLRPDDPRLLFERGHLLEKAGRPAEAVADFRRAGLVRAEAGDAAGARACAEQLRKLDATKAAAEVEGRLVPAPRGTDPP